MKIRLLNTMVDIVEILASFSGVSIWNPAALWTVLSFSTFVFPQCSSYGLIMVFSGVTAIDKSDVNAKGQGQK